MSKFVNKGTRIFHRGIALPQLIFIPLVVIAS